MENSRISWTDHTFNPVRGCRYAELPDGSPSPACEQGPGCYAESMSKRNPATLGEWGADGARVFGGESYWKQPMKWNADAEKAGERRRVFCASLADIFEGEDRDGVELREGVRPDYVEMLWRLFDLIRATPWLDWLLLTKRPWNAVWWAQDGEEENRLYGKGPWTWPENVWIGATIENQSAWDDRAHHLLSIRATVRFLSMEPLFGPVSMEQFLADETDELIDDGFNEIPESERLHARGIQWVIVGGQSGPGAVPLDLDAVRDVVRQCEEAGVPVFVKQLGSEWAKANGSATRAGTDPSEWPAELQVQEFPHV